MVMNSIAVYAVACICAYLVGSVPFGFLIGKARGVDVRTVGSKNIGATNVYRTVGKKWGFLAFACDFLKGLLPTLAAKWYAGSHGGLEHLALAVGVACVVGHTLTIFMKFKGGKGVATAFGMLVGLMPWLVLSAFALFVVTVALSHYISLGSCLAAAFLAVAVWFPIPHVHPEGRADLPLCVLVTLIAVFVVWKHRSNIKRLARGEENKIF